MRCKSEEEVTGADLENNGGSRRGKEQGIGGRRVDVGRDKTEVDQKNGE